MKNKEDKIIEILVRTVDECIQSVNELLSMQQEKTKFPTRQPVPPPEPLLSEVDKLMMDDMEKLMTMAERALRPQPQYELMPIPYQVTEHLKIQSLNEAKKKLQKVYTILKFLK